MNNNEFLKKRRKYLNQLKNNLELLTQLSKNNNLGSKIVDILLDPKNNKELAFAIDYFNNYEMVQKIVRMIRYGQLVISSPEESNAFNYVYEYIKMYKNIFRKFTILVRIYRLLSKSKRRNNFN